MKREREREEHNAKINSDDDDDDIACVCISQICQPWAFLVSCTHTHDGKNKIPINSKSVLFYLVMHTRSASFTPKQKGNRINLR